MSTARANLKTIHGISHNINATLKRLEDDKLTKEKCADDFLNFIMDEPSKLIETRKELEKALKKGIRAIDLVDNAAFAQEINEFMGELTTVPMDEENCKTAREEMLNLFRIAYAEDTHLYEKMIVDAGSATIEFINKLTHFVDTVRKDAKDFVKGREED